MVSLCSRCLLYSRIQAQQLHFGLYHSHFKEKGREADLSNTRSLSHFCLELVCVACVISAEGGVCPFGSLSVPVGGQACVRVGCRLCAWSPGERLVIQWADGRNKGSWEMVSIVGRVSTTPKTRAAEASLFTTVFFFEAFLVRQSHLLAGQRFLHLGTQVTVSTSCWVHMVTLMTKLLGQEFRN